MRLLLKQLLHLSVETRTGTKLGRVHDVVFETDGQCVAQYAVKPALLGRGEYRISPAQVVAFLKDKMIVDDTVRPVAAPPSSFKKQLPNAEPVAMRTER